ncbi:MULTISPECIES: hypothetical protein [Streptomyces]|uniref:Uncharacterized protein n=1 Tax=Streptomyces gilvifuscus TaxID=1550617 RepID=A0ABT5G487_9ACTN|nr:hypothetical protein [Streptomyces gilvifuscus]MDC2959629.1 hypothetical protein [Streptomyces gilvifuscus]
MRWLGHGALAVVMAAVIGWAGATAGSAGAHAVDGRSLVLATDVGPTH